MISNFFAAEDGPHIAIAPETLFTVGGFPITNSMIYGWLSATLIFLLLLAGARRLKLNGTKGPAQILEVGTEFMIGVLATSLGSRERAVKYVPIFVSAFFFIMMNNWLGLFPGVGPAVEYNGNPLLRPFTADLNATLAMAVCGLIFVHAVAISDLGFKNYAKHFFPGNPLNPVTPLIGAFEIFTEFTRLLSLALRLFLNIGIGEVLIAVAADLGGPLASISALPFTLLEIFVGALQAYIFVVLCAAYLSAFSAHGDHKEEHA